MSRITRRAVPAPKSKVAPKSKPKVEAKKSPAVARTGRGSGPKTNWQANDPSEGNGALNS